MKQLKIKSILTPSINVYTAELQESILDGWRVDFEKTSPALFGYQFECHLFKEVEEEAPPKLTRAEICEKARAAKLEKSKT